MEYIRFIKLQGKIKSSSIPFKITGLPSCHIYADMLGDFKTTKNTLSVFALDTPSEEIIGLTAEERIVIHYELITKELISLSTELNYVKLDDQYLATFGLKTNKTNIGNYYDIFANESHHDIVDLNSQNLSHLIYDLNEKILNGDLKLHKMSREQLKICISKFFNTKGINHYNIPVNIKNPYQFIDYLNMII